MDDALSKISTIYDNLQTLVGAALSTWKRLPNPYVADQNAELLLTKGYGIAIGPGRNRPDIEVGCRAYYERIFNVVLTQQITTTDHDSTARAAIEKALVEAFYAVRRAIDGDNTLSAQAVSVDYQDDSGIELLLGARAKCMSINVNFLVLYQESL